MARLKPPYKPAIDPRWLGLGLKAAWAFNEGSGTPRDALNGLAATLASSDWGSGAQGPVIVHDATTDRTELVAASSALLPTGDVTIVLGARKTDGTNRDSGAFGVDTATAAEYCAVKLPAADGTVYWDYGGTTGGTTRLTAAGLTFGDDAWGFTVGARGMEIWQNGVLRASNSANPTRTATSAACKLGIYELGPGRRSRRLQLLLRLRGAAFPRGHRAPDHGSREPLPGCSRRRREAAPVRRRGVFGYHGSRDRL